MTLRQIIERLEKIKLRETEYCEECDEEVPVEGGGTDELANFILELEIAERKQRESTAA